MHPDARPHICTSSSVDHHPLYAFPIADLSHCAAVSTWVARAANPRLYRVLWPKSGLGVHEAPLSARVRSNQKLNICVASLAKL